MAGTSSTPGFRSVFAAIKVTPLALHKLLGDAPQSPRPFITISREGGAGGRTIGRLLTERLNELDPGGQPWSLWDKELVEKVANDHHISRELIESLESSHKPWMQEFLSTLSMQGDLAEVRVYRGVATTIRALALHGRVIIIGRGGAFITRQMPGGVHLRLVAPLEFRINTMARQLNLTHSAAVEHVRRLDREREAFYKRYWPKEVCSPDAFTLTINTAHMDEQHAAECVLPLVLPGAHVAVPHAVSEIVSEGL